MARPPPSRAHDHDCLRLPPASSPQNSEAGKKESTVHRLNQLCPPCATPFSKSSLDHRRSVARVVKNGFTANSGVSESAKVVLGCVLINVQMSGLRAKRKVLLGQSISGFNPKRTYTTTFNPAITQACARVMFQA